MTCSKDVRRHGHRPRGNAVNIHERVVVMDLSEERDRPQFFINPEIEPYGEFVEGEEGCLSVPGYYDAVTRAERYELKP